MEIKPLEHLRILTTEEEERKVDALLNKKEKQGLICSECGSTRFTIEAYVKSKIEILNESSVVIITGIQTEVAYANMVLECALCKSKKAMPISIN